MKLSDIIKAQGDLEILEFEQAGKIVTALIPIYGKVSQAVKIVNIPALNIDLCKEVKYEFFYMKGNPPEFIQKQQEKYNKTCEILRTFGAYFMHTSMNVYIYINKNIYLGAFSGSNNPEAWKKKQKELENIKKVAQVEKKLNESKK